MSALFSLSTGDPRFDPREPVTINGYAFSPVPTPASAESEHRYFTVSRTAYLRNLDREDLRADCIAVHYQRAPTRTETGTSIGMRFPMLIIAGYLDEKQKVAERVADILEQHWSDEDHG